MKVYEGNIVTCDENNSVFSFLVEDKGKIVFVGNELPQQYINEEKVKLLNKALLPAFADTHIHFTSFSVFSSGLDIREAKSFEDIGNQIKTYANESNEKYILAFGASAHNVTEKNLVDKAFLDRVMPDKPVIIIKYDGHASIINSKLMEQLPKKIHSMRGFNSETGQLNQEAFFACTDYITSKVAIFKLIKNMLTGVDKMAQKGIGMMHTVEGVGFIRDLDVDLVRLFSRGLKNDFQTRIFFQTMEVKKVLKRKMPRIGGCFATALDGCFGSEDAALLEPYSNNSKNTGVLFYSQEQVTKFAIEANRAGLQIELHAIGDKAFEQAVNAIEAALKDSYREDHRHTIIHACIPTEAGLKKVAEYGIGIAAQPAFLEWPLEPLPYVESILGHRAYEISPLKQMLDMGIHISGGSDAPCTLPDPIEGIYCACNHYVKDQSISIAQALRMYTYEAAWMSFDEMQRGTLEKHKIADMVILNSNPLQMEAKDLRSLQVEKLILNGKDYETGQGVGNLALRAIKGKKRI